MIALDDNLAAALKARAQGPNVTDRVVVASDTDFRDLLGAKAMSDFFGNLLATTYPGYRWYVEPHPHSTHPFVDIRLEAGGGALGFTVCPKKHHSYQDIRHFTIMQGGELLERHSLNRHRFDEIEFITRPHDFSGCTFPHLDGVAL